MQRTRPPRAAPFDRERDGFIYGEACAAVVVESAERIQRGGLTRYARCSGGAVTSDANRGPNPSLEGEMRAIAMALSEAGVSAGAIDYVNPHGSASRLGDETELQAIRASGLDQAWLNATKSITGHGLSAAGAVEIVATLLQMKASRLHPTRNLEIPIEPSRRWVRSESVPCTVKNALTLSIGFGGINSALCLQQVSGTVS